jgi:hypothetical protein
VRCGANFLGSRQKGPVLKRSRAPANVADSKTVAEMLGRRTARTAKLENIIAAVIIAQSHEGCLPGFALRSPFSFLLGLPRDTEAHDYST